MRCQGVTTEEVLAAPPRPESGGEEQAGLERREVGVHVAGKGAIALLEPQRLDRVVPRVRQTEGPRVTGRPQDVVHRERVLHRYDELPSDLADVGHPGRPQRYAADLDLPAGGERERTVRPVR